MAFHHGGYQGSAFPMTQGDLYGPGDGQVPCPMSHAEAGGYPAEAPHPAQVDEYGAGAYWQPPQAPKLSAAAARASSLAGLYPYYQSSVYGVGMTQHPLPTPWYPGYGYSGPYPHQSGPLRDHQQLEHQLLLHHQLSKLQAPQQHTQSNSFDAPHDPHRGSDPMYAPVDRYWELQQDAAYRTSQHDPIATAIRRAEANRAAQEWQEADQEVHHANQAAFGAVSRPTHHMQPPLLAPQLDQPSIFPGRTLPPPDAYDLGGVGDLSAASSAGAFGNSVVASRADPLHWYGHHSPVNTSSQAWARGAQDGDYQRWATENTHPGHAFGRPCAREGGRNDVPRGAQGYGWEQHRHSQSSDAVFDKSWERAASAVHPYDAPTLHGDANARRMFCEALNVHSGDRLPDPQGLGNGAYAQPPPGGDLAGSHFPGQNRCQPWNGPWQGQNAPSQALISEHSSKPGYDVGVYPGVSPAPPPPSAEQKPASDPSKDSGPAPPSPDTLDKSAVPLASFGAEIVWNACAALLEPKLWTENANAFERVASYGSSSSGSSNLSGPTSPSCGMAVIHPKVGHWSSPGAAIADSTFALSSRHRQGFPGSFAPLDSADTKSHLVVGTVHDASAPRRGAAPQHRAVGSQRTSHRSGQSLASMPTPDAGCNSADSSASSSEPGTPPYAAESSTDSTGKQPKAQTTLADGGRTGVAAATRGLGFDDVVDMAMKDTTSNGEWSSPRRQEQSSGLISSNWSQLGQRSRAVGANKSQDRARDAILSVLNLTSPNWCWSRTGEKFPSLVTSPDQSGHAAAEAHRQLSAPSKNARPPSFRRLSNNSTSNARKDSGFLYGAPHGSEPSPAFRRFAHQVLAQTLLSPTALVLAMLYVARLPLLLSPIGNASAVDPEELLLFTQPSSAAPFKLLTLGLMMANKYLDDNTFTNATWKDVTGIPLNEINALEQWYLLRCGFEVSVPDNVWSDFLGRLHGREEAKLAAFNAARRASIDEHFGRSSTAMDRQSSLNSNVSGQSNTPAPGAEEVSKRVLITIDEMLAAIGQVPPFMLNEPSLPAISPPSDDHVVSKRGASAERDKGRMRRPSAALHYSHQHCHSAPAGVLDNAYDVFDEQDGPYRPLDRPSLDTALSRSQSDNAGASAKAPLSSNDNSAPLGPSALLSILDRGRSFAHLRHNSHGFNSLASVQAHAHR